MPTILLNKVTLIKVHLTPNFYFILINSMYIEIACKPGHMMKKKGHEIIIELIIGNQMWHDAHQSFYPLDKLQNSPCNSNA